MAVDLIVEDGTGVADANSYATVDECRTFAAQRLVDLPEEDDEVAVMLIQAFQYFERLDDRFSGTRVFLDSVFPRKDLRVLGTLLPDDSIHTRVKAAQCQLVLEQVAGADLFASTSAADYIIRERVGPIDTTYADPSLFGGVTLTFPAVDAFLGVFYRGEPGTLQVMRA